MKQHDHDMIAEDRPSTEDIYTDVELANRIIWDTLIMFKATYRNDDNEAAEFVYTTHRRKSYWGTHENEWEDEQLHDSLFDAIKDATDHAPEDDQWTEPELLRLMGQMINEASHNARGAKS
jgi:hypothetical protein